MSERKTASKVMSVIATVLIVVLAIIFLNNVLFIILGAKSDTPPRMLGLTPMVVLSGSMEGDDPGCFRAGSLLLLKKPTDIEVGDVIAFKDPMSRNGSIVTHRVIEITADENGAPLYFTKGDANNAADEVAIPAGNLVGEYLFHIPFMGKMMIFFQEPAGMLLCIGVPMFAFIGYDVIRGKKSAKKKADKTAEMEAELARLRALAGEAEKSETSEAANQDEEKNLGSES